MRPQQRDADLRVLEHLRPGDPGIRGHGRPPVALLLLVVGVVAGGATASLLLPAHVHVLAPRLLQDVQVRHAAVAKPKHHVGDDRDDSTCCAITGGYRRSHRRPGRHLEQVRQCCRAQFLEAPEQGRLERPTIHQRDDGGDLNGAARVRQASEQKVEGPGSGLQSGDQLRDDLGELVEEVLHAQERCPQHLPHDARHFLPVQLPHGAPYSLED
mmetsp:Transcript_46998/g.135410  ORF Transcript_46998/g.135410 Transcript_46998/m.135410 type:complete len:213 (-) Transcript_46998:1259-1897(-)